MSFCFVGVFIFYEPPPGSFSAMCVSLSHLSIPSRPNLNMETIVMRNHAVLFPVKIEFRHSIESEKKCLAFRNNFWWSHSWKKKTKTINYHTSTAFPMSSIIFDWLNELRSLFRLVFRETIFQSFCRFFYCPCLHALRFRFYRFEAIRRLYRKKLLMKWRFNDCTTRRKWSKWWSNRV